MARKHYEWCLSEEPPLLGQHSIAKHNVLREYLEKYVSVLAARPQQRQLKLTLVDGFSGGGAYRHWQTNERITGSPLIMIDAMRAAQADANARRDTVPFELDVEYVFIEKKKQTVAFLENELRNCPAAQDEAHRWSVVRGDFCEHLERIMQRVEQRGRSRRVIFVLDQYGYTDVPMSVLQRIFQRFPNAEVLLTIAVDWLVDHWTDSSQLENCLQQLGVELPASLKSQAKDDSPNDWRRVVQFELHREFHTKSGAPFYTPFFIASSEAHRSYWLLHFSGHPKARDVMMELHWQLQNHFEHFGGGGFQMLGFDPRRIPGQGVRTLPFAFDSQAEEESRHAIAEDLPRLIRQHSDGVPFSDFFRSVVNHTPATQSMIAEEIRCLTLEKELELYTAAGQRRRNGVQLDGGDIVKVPEQKILFVR